MKQKIVVRVSMDDEKSRSKALKISVCISGVESAALKGDQVEVVGEGIDAVELTRQLRKSMSHAELLSVADADKKDNSSSSAAATLQTPEFPPHIVWVPPQYAPLHHNGYAYSGYAAPAQTEQSCTIM